MKKKIEKMPYIINFPSELIGITTEDVVYYLRDMKDKLDELIDAHNEEEKE